MPPKVSVIIPIYNEETYLAEALESVLGQTYRDIEIICINDGSTDSSAQILHRYGSSITVISQPNRGQCAALNAGLKIAVGDYIKFFDADDVMNPRHIELQVKRLAGREDAVASCEWGRFYDDNPQSAVFTPEPVWRDMDSLSWLKTSLKQKNDMMGGWLWLIPRGVLLKAGGWDERLSLNNDFEFSVRLLTNVGEVLFTPGARLYYRSGMAGSLANIKSEQAYRAALLSTRLGCGYLLSADSGDDVRKMCANRYQEWIYRIYPHYADVVAEASAMVKELGGSDRKMEGGRVFTLLRNLLGWRAAKRIQLFFYKMGYLKFLKSK
jgi:glycosyltransferase involved in cell wall biosynthesis